MTYIKIFSFKKIVALFLLGGCFTGTSSYGISCPKGITTTSAACVEKRTGTSIGEVTLHCENCKLKELPETIIQYCEQQYDLDCAGGKCTSSKAPDPCPPLKQSKP